MRLIQALREIFYFPFYFVSLNMAGFLSFVKFIQGSPPMWEKGDRTVQVLRTVEEKESNPEDESVNFPQISSMGGGMR